MSFMQMLQFAVYLIMILDAAQGKGYDDALVQSVESTFDECSVIVETVADFILDGIDIRRRENHESLDDVIEGKLKTCRAIVAAADAFSGLEHSIGTVDYGSINLIFHEHTFLREQLEKISKKSGSLLYQASKDGDSSTAFHSACDDKGETIVIVETTNGAVFGGYTDQSWAGTGSYATSTTSFMFQLRPNLITYPIKSGRETTAIYRKNTYGPTFGSGYDLYLSSDCMSNTASYTNGGQSYAIGSTYQLTNGQKNFEVKDYVVLQALFYKF